MYGFLQLLILSSPLTFYDGQPTYLLQINLFEGKILLQNLLIIYVVLFCLGDFTCQIWIKVPYPILVYLPNPNRTPRSKLWASLWAHGSAHGHNMTNLVQVDVLLYPRLIQQLNFLIIYKHLKLGTLNGVCSSYDIYFVLKLKWYKEK